MEINQATGVELKIKMWCKLARDETEREREGGERETYEDLRITTQFSLSTNHFISF
jgi:hypothetical protein